MNYIVPTILSLFLFSCLLSCNSGHSSKSQLESYIKIENALAQDFTVLEDNIKIAYDYLWEATKRRPIYRPLLEMIDTILTVNMVLDAKMDQLHQALKKLPLDDEDSALSLFNNEESIALETLQEQLINIRRIYLEKIGQLFNLNVKGTIFADKQKKEMFLSDLEEVLPLPVEQYYQVKNNKTWVERTFHNQPVALSRLVLRKIQHEINTSKMVLVGKIASQTYIRSFERQTGELGIIPIYSKRAIRLGEQLEVDLVLGEQSTFPFRIWVNNEALDVKNYEATYNVIPQELGEHQYDVKIIVDNPHTEKSDTIFRQFRYEVIPPS